MNWSEPHDEPTPEQQNTLRYYVPTLAEIAAACSEIQRGWSEHERAKRRGIRKSDGDEWCVPRVIADGVVEPLE
jgi:hypothetical protein